MSDYFNLIPDFEYVSRLPDAKIGDYNIVKNLFRRIVLREYIYQKYEKPTFNDIPFTSIKEIIKKRNKDE